MSVVDIGAHLAVTIVLVALIVLLGILVRTAMVYQSDREERDERD